MKPPDVGTNPMTPTGLQPHPEGGRYREVFRSGVGVSLDGRDRTTRSSRQLIPSASADRRGRYPRRWAFAGAGSSAGVSSCTRILGVLRT